MTSSEAIVYSRTLTEDFHLITVPRSFSNEDVKWIRSRIDECMGDFVDKRSREPIFRAFENEKYYIVSVTVTAQDLKDCSLENICISDEQTKDQEGRQIYGFFAYVLEKDRGKINNRLIYNSLHIYSPLYDYVLRRWNISRNIGFDYSEVYDVPELEYQTNNSQPNDNYVARDIASFAGGASVSLLGTVIGWIFKLEFFWSIALVLLLSLLGCTSLYWVDKYRSKQ